ncbi:MAG: hypothetical protein ACODAJ_01550 [Planctomycetota bacterium]
MKRCRPLNPEVQDPRRAAALLLVLFIMAFSAPVVCLLLDAHTDHIRCTHNDIQATTALYVAQAGVHDAMAQLLADGAWRAGFSEKATADGLGHSYTVTLADGANGEIVITSTGTTVEGFHRTVTATVRGF